RVLAELGRLGGGHRVRILFVAGGSVRLTLAAPPAALQALVELRARGELPQLCGLPVIDLVDLGDVSIAFELAPGDRVREPITAAIAAVDDLGLSPRSPYPGMRPFSKSEADQFLRDREREIEEFLAPLRGALREVDARARRRTRIASAAIAGLAIAALFLGIS